MAVMPWAVHDAVNNVYLAANDKALPAVVFLVNSGGAELLTP